MPRATTLLLAALLGLPGIAAAGSLGVGPTLIELGARRQVQVLHVRNTGSEVAVVQVEAVRWNQQDDADHYTPTDEIAASPAVFELAPGAEREVRVGWRGGALPAGERAYRLYVSEVVPEGGVTAQLNFAVRVGIPVFTEGGASRAGNRPLSWRMVEDGSGCTRLQLRNDSATRQRITRLELQGSEGVMWEHESPLYVLAGATRLAGPAHCGAAHAPLRLLASNEKRAVDVAAAAR